MAVLAHVGHWVIYVLYAVPVVVVGVSIVISFLRQRRERQSARAPGSAEG